MDTGIWRHHGDEGARGKGTDTLPPATCHMIIIVDAALTLSEMNSYYFNSFWLIIKLETHCIKSLSLLSAEKKKNSISCEFLCLVQIIIPRVHCPAPWSQRCERGLQGESSGFEPHDKVPWLFIWYKVQCYDVIKCIWYKVQCYDKMLWSGVIWRFLP